LKRYNLYIGVRSGGLYEQIILDFWVVGEEILGFLKL